MTAPAALEGAVMLLALVLPVSIAGTNAALALLTAAWATSAAKGGADWGRLRSAAVFALLAYVLAAFLSGALGIAPAESLGILRKDLHKLWVSALLLLCFARRPSPGAFKPLGTAFAVVALVGIVQVASGLGAAQWPRAHGFVHPVAYGEQMALAVLGGLCFRRSGRLPAAFLGLAGLALVLNQTRGAFLGLAAGFAALCVLDKDLRRSAPWAAAAAAAVLVCWEFMPTGRHIHELLRDPQLVEGGKLNPHLARYALWEVALRIFKDHPWLGVGPGNYRLAFPGYFHAAVDSENLSGSAHNLYLHQLAERGLIGFLALAAVLGVLAVSAWRAARKHPSPWTFWAAGSLAAFLVMNLTETAFQNEQVTTLILFAWAWGQANAAPGEKSYNFRPRR